MNPHGYPQATYAPPVSAATSSAPYDPNTTQTAGAQFTVNVAVPYNPSAVLYNPAAAPSTTNPFHLNPNGPSPVALGPPVYNSNIPGNSIPFPTDSNSNPTITYDPAAIHLNRKVNEDVDMLSTNSDILRAIQQDIQAQREQNTKDIKNLQDGINNSINGLKEEVIGLAQVIKEYIALNSNGGGRAHGGFQG